MNDRSIEIDKLRFAAVRRTAAYKALNSAWLEPVLIACSGGVDSTALLATAAVARRAGRVGPFVVAQVDHGVREHSDWDGRFVAAVARAFGHPFVQLRLSKRADLSDGGTEAGLRKWRYATLAAAIERLGVSTVITAHTKDDQVETILLRLMSGAGPVASAGMRSTQTLETECGRVHLQRPFLAVSRAQLAQVLSILTITPVEDPTNKDVSFRRNRLRARIIPEMLKLDPGFSDGLIRSIDLVRMDAEYIDRVADREFVTQVQKTPGKRVIARSVLADLDRVIGSRVVRAAIMELIDGDTRELTQERVEAVISAANGRVGAAIEIPYGIIVKILRDEIVIEKRKQLLSQ